MTGVQTCALPICPWPFKLFDICGPRGPDLGWKSVRTTSAFRDLRSLSSRHYGDNIKEFHLYNANVSGGNFPAPFAGEMSSCIMTTIFIQSFTQSRRISSGVCTSQNLNSSIFILVSSIVLWHLIFFLPAIKYLPLRCLNLANFSQARGKIWWQQQEQHKREPTTRVSQSTLFTILPLLPQGKLVSQSQPCIWLIIQHLKQTTRNLMHHP